MPLNDKLFDRLHMAKRPDLLVLLEDLKLDLNEYNKLDNNELITIISRELRSAAGNSVANVGRQPHDFSYKQILIDVADRLCSDEPGQYNIFLSGYKMTDKKSVDVIEEYIYHRVHRIWTKHISSNNLASKEDLYILFSKEIGDRGGLLFHPHVWKGALFSSSWFLANQIFGPNYKKILPAVIRLILIKKSHEIEGKL